MDKIDRLYQRKRFFRTLYKESIGEGNNLINGQYIRLFQSKNDFTKVTFWNNIDDLNSYVENTKTKYNTYFTLSTTDGEGGTENNLKQRHMIAFDFDKKDYDGLDSKDIMFKFKELRLYYHCLIDSGHGYHAYVLINQTDDIKKVIEVTKAIGTKLGADTNAMLGTQLLRVPLSLNLKDKTKQVNIIQLYKENTIKRYDIDKLYKIYCNGKYNENNDNRATTHILDNIKTIKPCVKNILQNGSKNGNKNSDLQKIVINLKRLNKTINDILYVCKDWNNKCENKFSEHELDYQVKYMYDNLEKCSYECKGCEFATDCFSVVESDFNYGDDEEMINIEYKVAKKLKYSKKTSIMEGNKLLILNVLKHWDKELTVDDIIKHLTYKGKCALSERTIREMLPILYEEKYIIKIQGNRRLGISDKYKINLIKTDIKSIFSMSYFPTLICIYGIITPEELRLYTHMRYKHSINESSKGNIFRINQEELAKDLNITQPRISEMINNLIESKILEIWEVNFKDNGFKYYTYRLVK